MGAQNEITQNQLRKKEGRVQAKPYAARDANTGFNLLNDKIPTRRAVLNIIPCGG